MSGLTNPARLFITSNRRQPGQFTDEFIANLLQPVINAKKMSLERVALQYTPQYPSIPVHSSIIQVAFADGAFAGLTNFQTALPSGYNTDTGAFRPGVVLTPAGDIIQTDAGLTTPLLGFDATRTYSDIATSPDFIGTEIDRIINGIANGFYTAGAIGSSAVITTSVDVRQLRMTLTESGTVAVEIRTSPAIDNLNQTLFYRMGFTEKMITNLADDSILIPAGGSITGSAAQTLARTSVIYVQTDLDTGSSSETGLQNLATFVVNQSQQIGQMLVGEDLNDLPMQQIVPHNFKSIRVKLLDDEFKSFELDDNSVVSMEFHVSYQADTLLG